MFLFSILIIIENKKTVSLMLFFYYFDNVGSKKEISCCSIQKLYFVINYKLNYIIHLYLCKIF